MAYSVNTGDSNLRLVKLGDDDPEVVTLVIPDDPPIAYIHRPDKNGWWMRVRIIENRPVICHWKIAEAIAVINEP